MSSIMTTSLKIGGKTLCGEHVRQLLKLIWSERWKD